MQRKYYLQELHKIRSIAKDFARDYPSLAPMLHEEATDPDVERLLEGFAFLTATVQEKLDQQLPELSMTLCSIFFPDCVAPIPSSVMMQFSPLANASNAITIPAGAEVASQSIEGVNCKFRLLAENKLEPINLLKNQFKQQPDGRYCLQLDFTLLGTTLAKWRLNELPMFISGSAEEASNLMYIMMNYCEKIALKAPDENEHVLPAENLRSVPVHQRLKEAIKNGPQSKLNSALTDYLVFPQTFLRPYLTGLSSWHPQGHKKQFAIRFYFSELPEWFDVAGSANIEINTFPAVNLFTEDADPINLNYERSEYPIYVAGFDPKQYAVYNVISVESLNPHSSGVLYEYRSILQELYQQNQDKHLYSLQYDLNELHNKVNFTISFADSDVTTKSGMETIIAKVNVCNASLASQLLPGQIDQSSYGSPENVEFKNLHVPSKYYPVDLEDMFRWRLISLLSYNYIAQSDIKLIKEIILLRTQLMVGYNQDVIKQKLDAIKNYQVNPSSLLHHGAVLAGYEISFTCQLSGFITQGEVFLFGEMLMLLLVSSLPINSFVRLSIEIAETGENIEWPARTVDQRLA